MSAPQRYHKVRGVSDPLAVFAAVLPVYLLILGGALLRKIRVLRQEHDEPVFHVLVHVLYPCLILDKMLGSSLLQNFKTVGWSLGVGFGLTVTGFAIAYLLGGLIGLSKGSGKRTFAITAGVQNFGYTAIPVIEQVWKSSGVLAIMFVHNLGVELAIWTVGVMMMSGEKKVPWRRLVNGPVIAVLLGLTLVSLNLESRFPHPPMGVEILTHGVRTCITWLGAGAFPAAILVIGAVMFDLVLKEKPSLKVVLGGCLTRLVILPALMLTVAKFLPMPLEMKKVLIVQAAMPSAMTPIMLARLYGGRPAVAVQVVVATTLGSLITLPWLISMGMKWLHLP